MNNRKKRIAFVCAHLFGGGSEKVMTILANYFSDKYNVTIITLNGKRRYSINNSIKVVDLGVSKGFFKDIKRIRKELIDIQPDTIIAFEYYVNLCVILASKRLRAKVIVSERNDPAHVGSGILKDRLRNYLYKKCDILVCQTNDARAYFPKKVQEHTTVILNPVVGNFPEVFKGVRKKEIVNFCRLHKQKNLPLLINSFSIFLQTHPDYTLHIYGDGPEKDSLIKNIHLLNLDSTVFLHDNVPTVFEKVYKSAMFVSSSDFEGLSNSMIEAMVIGLPTICTDCPCGGARMVIEDKINGLLVPVNDENALKDAMCLLADNEVFANKLSLEAAKVKEKLDIKTISVQWEELF